MEGFNSPITMSNGDAGKFDAMMKYIDIKIDENTDFYDLRVRILFTLRSIKADTSRGYFQKYQLRRKIHDIVKQYPQKIQTKEFVPEVYKIDNNALGILCATNFDEDSVKYMINSDIRSVEFLWRCDISNEKYMENHCYPFPLPPGFKLIHRQNTQCVWSLIDIDNMSVNDKRILKHLFMYYFKAPRMGRPFKSIHELEDHKKKLEGQSYYGSIDKEKWIKNIIQDLRITNEIYDLYIKSLKKVSEDQWIKLINVCNYIFHAIPQELLTYDTCLVAVRKTGTNIEYVPDKYKDFKMYKAAISCGMRYNTLPEEYRTKYFMKKAVKSRYDNLNDIFSCHDKVDSEVCRLAWIQNNKTSDIIVRNYLSIYVMGIDGEMIRGLRDNADECDMNKFADAIASEKKYFVFSTMTQDVFDKVLSKVGLDIEI